MKREKENQIILAKRRIWMISFSFGQLSFPPQYIMISIEIEFAIGSRPCSKGFSFCFCFCFYFIMVLRFSSLHKNQYFPKFPFHLERLTPLKRAPESSLILRG